MKGVAPWSRSCASRQEQSQQQASQKPASQAPTPPAPHQERLQAEPAPSTSTSSNVTSGSQRQRPATFRNHHHEAQPAGSNQPAAHDKDSQPSASRQEQSQQQASQKPASLCAAEQRRVGCSCSRPFSNQGENKSVTFVTILTNVASSNISKLIVKNKTAISVVTSETTTTIPPSAVQVAGANQRANINKVSAIREPWPKRLLACDNALAPNLTPSCPRAGP